MVHDGEDGVHADAKSFEAWGKQSARTRRTMYHIYLERMRYKNARLTVKEVETMCSHDRIFSAEEAVNAGLADMVMNTFVDITSGIGSGKKYVPVPNKGAKRR
jgi:ATP-dependent protease ClpP protease subunit